MLTCGGTYESSLILADILWEETLPRPQGKFIVAIPTRELLLVADSYDTEGIRKVSETAKMIFAEGPYRISSKLYIRNCDIWESYPSPN